MVKELTTPEHQSEVGKHTSSRLKCKMKIDRQSLSERKELVSSPDPMPSIQ